MVVVCSLPQTSASMVLIICRSAAAAGMSAEAFGDELQSSLLFTKESLTVVKKVWNAKGSALSALPKQVLSVGEVG